MSRLHLSPLVSALLLSACAADPDTCPDQGGTVLPIGIHYPYVVSRVSVPTSSVPAAEPGLDLDADGIADNQLGSVFAALAAQGLDVQGAMSAAIDRGDIILLIDLSMGGSSSLACHRLVGFDVKFGDKAQAMPPPCAGTGDAVCRKHLDGTGRMGISASSPENMPIRGSIRDHAFEGGSGSVSIQITFGGSHALQLDLIGARATASGLSETGIESVILAGGLTEANYRGQLISGLHTQYVVPRIMADCSGTAPPACGCAPGSTGKRYIDLFDTAPRDCQVSLEEIQNSATLDGLGPDVTIDGQRAYSFGMAAQAVRGTFQ